MRTFDCDSCGSALFFENDTCLTCGQMVGFRADEMRMCTAAAAASGGRAQCRNWTEYGACNWFVTGGAAEGTEYCVACDLNEVVPDLNDLQRRALWVETERAKRRLIFTLLQLGLPLLGLGAKRALRFRLLADERVDTGAVDAPDADPIYISHDHGCLTLNVVEADDAHREAMRKRSSEPYRTMLGHLRHEIGHYYWYLLVDGTALLPAFRGLFGDERIDYEPALQTHYRSGPPETWQQDFVSAYASAHPWEDFAETWAHYISIVDTLETASASGIAIGGRRIAPPLPLDTAPAFVDTLNHWRSLTVVLNQHTRSMGMCDAYPFALASRVVDKLRFVRDLCLQAALGSTLQQARRTLAVPNPARNLVHQSPH